MSALAQYINLFEEYPNLIDSKSAGALNIMRSKALNVLKNTDIPRKGSENYQITDMEALLAPDYGLNLQRVRFDVNLAASFHCNVPNISAALYMLVNDSFEKSKTAQNINLPEGVIAESLKDAAINHPEIVEKYYASVADINNVPVALNTLLVQDGFFLYIPKGVRLEKPLQLVNILNAASSFMAVRRLLIVVEDDAEAKLLSCDHTQSSEFDYLNLQVVEAIVGENARFEFYELEESTENTKRLSSFYLTQSANSHVVVNGTTLFNGITRNEYYCKFEGRNANLKLTGMGIEDSTRALDSFSRIEHNVPDCHSDELFKYVLDDEAKGAFVGRIYVAQGATKTEAYQSNRNIIGSDSARMYAKPQLEIYNDDVKCSHGTAIGQLDPMQLFYMRTRGLSDKTARLLLKQAFLMDIVDSVAIPLLRDRLRALVEARFEGRASSCSDCTICH